MFIKRNFLLAILLAFLVGCEKDEEKVTVMDGPKVYFGNRGIVIEWEPTDISGFRYYHVLRSTDGKEFTVIHGLTTGDYGSTDVNHTTYTDIVYPFADSLYYKIEVFGHERIVSPKSGLAVPAPMELDFDPISGYIMPERGEILFYKDDWRGVKFSLFDYKNGTIKKELNLETEITGLSQGFGKFNGNYECYFYDSMNPQMSIYDAVSFDYKGSFEYDKPYAYITSDFSNFLYYHDWGNIVIVNRNTLTTEIYSSKQNVMFVKVFIMEGRNQLLGITHPAGISIFELGDSGTIMSESYKKISDAGSLYYIQGTKYLYTQSLNDFKIINTDNWEEKRLLDENGQTLYPSLFHAKNGVLYACRGHRIYCYSLDNLELIEYFPTRIGPHLLLSDDKDLILIARTFESGAIIDKMKLSE